MLLNLLLCFYWITFKMYLYILKTNVFIQKNIICKTVCSQINFPFSYVPSQLLLSFLNLLENFRLVLPMKDLRIKKRVNSNLNADQSNFLANETVRHVLELYVKNNVIQNNSRPKSNYKIVYWTLPTFWSKHTQNISLVSSEWTTNRINILKI